MGAAAICADDPVPSVSDLADQVLEVLNYFRLGAVMCMGVMAGAYILTLFAMKFRERVLGLILVSPLCKAPSWTEWLCNKVMSNLLYYYGMCSLLKDCLLYRYFSKEVRGSAEVPESDIVQACRKLLDDRQSTNVLRFLQAINRRPDITDEKLVTINNHGSDAVLHVQCVYMDVLYINACKRFKHCPIMEQCYYTGSSLQVSGHGGAAIRNVSAHGIFSPGVWYTQKKSLKDSANLVQIPSNQCLKKTSILRMWRLMRFVRNEQIVFLNTYKTGTMWIDDRILGTSAYVRHM